MQSTSLGAVGGKLVLKLLFFSYLLIKGGLVVPNLTLFYHVAMITAIMQWWEVGTWTVGRWRREQYQCHCLKWFLCRKKIGWKSKLMGILIILVCSKFEIDIEISWLLTYHPWCLLNIIQCSKLWDFVLIVLIFRLGNRVVCIASSS